MTTSASERLSHGALPTSYDGTKYRSRLEARWAVFFRALGLRSEYEPQGYKTSEGYYLPDFWLPDLQLFAEVKPVPFTRTQSAKCAAVAHGTGFAFLLLAGVPDTIWYAAIQRTGDVEWLDFGESASKSRPWYAYAGPEYPAWSPSLNDAFSRAVIRAKCERFGT